MKKDQQILEQGQQMITFKNLLREFEQRELRYKNEREVLEQNIKSRDDDIKALRQVLTEKVNRSKEEIAQYEKRSASYERITLDLRQNNERLLKDVETLNMQIKQLQEKIKERTFEAELIKKRDTLEKESHDDISLALYKSNKEIELLKQTILELTHKSRMRYTEEAKLLTQKNEDFDEKMRDLTAAHTKKQLELEYQIQELKQENQALKFDLNQIKEKERQMLENIKNQFNQLI